MGTVEYDLKPTARRRRETEIFTKDMSLMEALQANPRACEVFVAYGMGCISCMCVSTESIEDGARMHGIDPDEIVDELNKLGESQNDRVEGVA